MMFRLLTTRYPSIISSRRFRHGVASPLNRIGTSRFFFGGRTFPPIDTPREERIRRVKDLAEFYEKEVKHRLVMNVDESVGEVPGSAFTASSLNLLQPINASELDILPNDDKVFFCTIVTPCVVFKSAQMLVEDSQNEIVELSVYNFDGDPSKWFYEGRRIAIIEPYYKMRADLTPGIRVDNPALEIYLDWVDEDMEPNSN